jgi:DNA repair protein RadC
VIKLEKVSEGGFSGTVVDPKRIFHLALQHKASQLIIAHNHPSGNLTPSGEDIRITEKLIQAGRLLEIQVLDHLIVTESNYYSFADEGKMMV